MKPNIDPCPECHGKECVRRVVDPLVRFNYRCGSCGVSFGEREVNV